ncbi:hypothetical protein V6N13_088750 [Hibiscus sabdariffa]|uniref:Uncharacterized protein n=1 Tax=Hibiscus sabdariffa TaxID=183260 RepID=A0ABR2G139_9ROSI
MSGGKFVRVDDENLAPTSFERGYVLIETSFARIIREEIDIHIGDLSYRLFIKEEDWSGPVVECECGLGDSTRSDSHVSNTNGLDVAIEGAVREVASEPALGQGSNVPDLNGVAESSPGWINHIWEDNMREDLCVVSDQLDEVNNSTSEESDLNIQLGDKVKRYELVKRGRSFSSSVSLSHAQVIASAHERIDTSSTASECNLTENFEANTTVVQVHLGSDDIVQRKRGRGRPGKNSVAPSLKVVQDSSKCCNSQDSLSLRREIDATITLGGMVGVKSIGKEDDII